MRYDLRFYFVLAEKRRDEDYDEDVEETLLDEVRFLIIIYTLTIVKKQSTVMIC